MDMKMTAIKKTPSPLNRGVWISGKINGEFYFETLVFDSPGEFSLTGTCISKLFIKRIGGATIFNYDRGEDMAAADEQTKFLVRFISEVMKEQKELGFELIWVNFK